MSELPGGAEQGLRRGPEWAGLLRSVVLPLAILAVIVGGLFYWNSRGGGGAADAYGTVDLPADRNATDEEPRPEEGRAAPDFILETPEGAPRVEVLADGTIGYVTPEPGTVATLRLSDLQGHPVVVNFWASWCPPCRAEMPELVQAYDAYRDEGLVIVGVNLQEPDDMVLDFAEDFGVEFPLVIDRDGELSDVWRLGGPINGIPTSYFIDETGVVRDFFYGPMNEKFLAEGLETIGVSG